MLPSPPATLRKMCSPQMMGVDPLHAGSGSFHAMLSVVLHFTGRLVSPLMLLRFGPRHWGQFSPDPAAARSRKMAAILIRKQDTAASARRTSSSHLPSCDFNDTIKQH